MKKTNIIYWVLTILFALPMLSAAVPDILVLPEAIQAFKEMGYPAYLLPFLGWAKLLGVIAILVPGFPRLKEWAYAGLIFDLLGAAYSVLAMGQLPWMLLIVGLGIGSYVFYHKKRSVASVAGTAPQPGNLRPDRDSKAVIVS